MKNSCVSKKHFVQMLLLHEEQNKEQYNFISKNTASDSSNRHASSSSSQLSLQRKVTLPTNDGTKKSFSRKNTAKM